MGERGGWKADLLFVRGEHKDYVTLEYRMCRWHLTSAAELLPSLNIGPLGEEFECAVFKTLQGKRTLIH